MQFLHARVCVRVCMCLSLCCIYTLHDPSLSLTYSHAHTDPLSAHTILKTRTRRMTLMAGKSWTNNPTSMKITTTKSHTSHASLKNGEK